MLLAHVSYHNVSAAASTNLRYLCFYQIAEVLIAPFNPHPFAVLSNSGGAYFITWLPTCVRCREWSGD